jgi:hypothetical protein
LCLIFQDIVSKNKKKYLFLNNIVDVLGLA